VGGLILQAVGECCEDELLYEKTSSSAVCNSDGDSGANSDYFHCSFCKSNKRIVVSLGVKGRKHGLPTIAASFPLQERKNVPTDLVSCGLPTHSKNDRIWYESSFTGQTSQWIDYTLTKLSINSLLLVQTWRTFYFLQISLHSIHLERGRLCPPF